MDLFSEQFSSFYLVHQLHLSTHLIGILSIFVSASAPVMSSPSLWVDHVARGKHNLNNNKKNECSIMLTRRELLIL